MPICVSSSLEVDLYSLQLRMAVCANCKFVLAIMSATRLVFRANSVVMGIFRIFGISAWRVTLWLSRLGEL